MYHLSAFSDLNVYKRLCRRDAIDALLLFLVKVQTKVDDADNFLGDSLRVAAQA